MDVIRESMQLPLDNVLGMLLYAFLFITVAGLLTLAGLKWIPNQLPYAVKSVVVFVVVCISLVIWYQVLIEPAIP
ncbi:hypothetical protein J416_06862 [Gracilibacillus halophilus YIM-C55.5]|uniref:Uncharacterized protein n=1 Tax=Gracilibacillus halophilus YIM-C55.5 TaxID=1308866 RepID=N4WA32_9BACI|nr:hypothetical protein [Gracilibacillus halophilus]ENH97148.1 hypothetical protein J416_06862 [Gracilibacillus halophilus YIM-C55.5]